VQLGAARRVGLELFPAGRQSIELHERVSRRTRECRGRRTVHGASGPHAREANLIGVWFKRGKMAPLGRPTRAGLRDTSRLLAGQSQAQSVRASAERPNPR